MNSVSYDRQRRRRRRLLMLIWYMLNNQSRRRYYFRSSLSLEGRQRRDRNLVRAALLDPKNSTWQKCYDCCDDGVLITVTGYDYVTFQFLLELFEPLFLSYTPWCSKYGGVDGLNYMKISELEKRGRKWSVTAQACLGLVLA